jgi:hypothetical protein
VIEKLDSIRERPRQQERRTISNFGFRKSGQRISVVVCLPTAVSCSLPPDFHPSCSGA